MALTFAPYVDKLPLGGSRYLWLGSITLDNSYPTNGEAIAASDFGADKILFVQLSGAANIVTKSLEWDRTNSKIKVFVEDAISGIAAEAANASDQSLVVIDAMVIVEDLTP